LNAEAEYKLLQDIAKQKAWRLSGRVDGRDQLSIVFIK
jgi:hypothetical protein